LLLDVGCLTQLSRCYVYHGAESMDGLGESVKRDLSSTVAGKTGSFELERTAFAVNAPFAKPQALAGTMGPVCTGLALCLGATKLWPVSTSETTRGHSLAMPSSQVRQDRSVFVTTHWSVVL